MSLTRENENNANLYRAISEKEFKNHIKLSDVMGWIKKSKKGNTCHQSMYGQGKVEGYNEALKDLKKQLESKGG